MKKLKYYLTVTCISFLSFNCYSQSISSTKIYSFLESQNQNLIIKTLIERGFTYQEKNKTDNSISLTTYIKNGSLGKEIFSIGSNDELFMIVYHPTTKAYNSLKEIFLKSDFKYAYKYGNTKYFENGSMRIGSNDIIENLSFFCNLK